MTFSPSAVARLLGLLAALVLLPACQKDALVQVPPAGPDYSRQLGPGESALRKITDLSQWPDVRAAYSGRDAGLTAALDQSIAWFAKPSAQKFYPMESFTHEQAQASVIAFRQVLTEAASPDDFVRRLQADFDAYTSVGYNNEGVVFFTGYFSPVFTASRVRTEQYRFPLYRRPADLVSDPVTGQTLGRKVGEQMQPYPKRAEIEANPAAHGLAGRELVWFADKLDAYIVQVNGSARLRMTDGSSMLVGYAGTNGHEYTSIGRLLVQEGKMDRNRVSLAAIRSYFQQSPGELDRYIARNDRFVFFQEYAEAAWPAGALGTRVTAFRSLATDKQIYPRGGVVVAQTTVPVRDGGARNFRQFMLDQDAGGAIRAPGRADIYMGIGNDAEALAGRQAAEGRLYYLMLKPEKIAAWKQRIAAPGRPG